METPQARLRGPQGALRRDPLRNRLKVPSVSAAYSARQSPAQCQSDPCGPALEDSPPWPGYNGKQESGQKNRINRALPGKKGRLTLAYRPTLQHHRDQDQGPQRHPFQPASHWSNNPCPGGKPLSLASLFRKMRLSRLRASDFLAS